MQELSQSIKLLMFKKTNKKEKKDYNNNEIHISYCKNVRKFNNHDFFIYIDAERCSNINSKKYKAKNKQIINETLF